MKFLCWFTADFGIFVSNNGDEQNYKSWDSARDNPSAVVQVYFIVCDKWLYTLYSKESSGATGDQVPIALLHLNNITRRASGLTLQAQLHFHRLSSFHTDTVMGAHISPSFYWILFIPKEK